MGEAESGTAGEGAEHGGGMLNGEGGKAELDGEIAVNADAAWDSFGVPGWDEAIVAVEVAVDEDPEIMDPCKEGKVVDGFEEGAWWQCVGVRSPDFSDPGCCC